MSTPLYRSAPPSLSGSAISLVKATTPSSPLTKSSGIAALAAILVDSPRSSAPGLQSHCLSFSDCASVLAELSTQIGRASCRERVCQYVDISCVAESVKQKNLEAETK